MLGVTGIAGLEPTALSDNLTPLFDEILKLPKYSPPATQDDANVYNGLQLLVANVAKDEFRGKLGIGRIMSGTLKQGMDVSYGKPNPTSTFKKGKIASLNVFSNMGQVPSSSVGVGDIALIAGIPDISIGYVADWMMQCTY
jgi:GTP-binding protein